LAALIGNATDLVVRPQQQDVRAGKLLLELLLR
jgi:hypothetical protein